MIQILMSKNMWPFLFTQSTVSKTLTVNSKFLNVGLLNVGSLGTKHEEFQRTLIKESLDILAINETWLSAGQDGKAPVVPGYRLIHSPRSHRLRDRGGGVGFYVKRGVSVRKCPCPCAHASVEQMWLSTSVKASRLIIGTAYRPDWVNVDIFFDALTDAIMSFTNYDYLILLGDFNINLLEDYVDRNKLTEFLNYANLINYNTTEPTHFTSHSAKLIDYICTDAPVHSHKVTHYSELGGHAMLCVILKIKKAKATPKRISYRQLKNIDYNTFEYDLQSIDWDAVSTLDTVDEMVDAFTKTTLQLFDIHAPVKSLLVKEPLPPWLTSNVRYMMDIRDCAHDTYRTSKIESHKTYYKELKHMVNVSIFSEKRAYFDMYINKYAKDSKTLWRNLKNTVLPNFKNNSNLPDHLCDPDRINDHFLNIPGTISTNISDLTYFEFNRHNNNNFYLKPIDENLILKYLKSIKSKAQGIDGINNDLVMLTLPNTLKCITSIVNKSILSSTFPSLWKIALVKPLPKISDPSDMKDLRPISILPFLSKVLEKAVYEQVLDFCNRNDIFPELQSGFRRGRSTASALSDVVDNILAAQDTGQGTILALLDFSRAFDSLNISMLLSKLSYYGFDESAIKWFHSYLSGREQRVEINKIDGSILASTHRPVVRGVPQGSILAPLLFILYSADIVSNIRHCKFHMYADDLQIYFSLNPANCDEASKLINEDLAHIYEWSRRNSLILNPVKSKIMILGTKLQKLRIKSHYPKIYIAGEQIPEVDVARNLGLLMDSRLQFESHVSELVRNCFYRLKVLYRIRPFITTDLRVRIVDSLVLSKLNYCLTVYGPCLLARSSRLIQRVQNACARYCFTIPPRTHVTPYLNNSSILKMEGRLKLFYSLMLFDVITKKTPEYLYRKLTWRYADHRYNTRLCSWQLVGPKHKTAAFRGSFRYLATKCWNDLPPPIRNLNSKYTFKKEIRKYLLDLQKGLCI